MIINPMFKRELKAEVQKLDDALFLGKTKEEVLEDNDGLEHAAMLFQKNVEDYDCAYDWSLRAALYEVFQVEMEEEPFEDCLVEEETEEEEVVAEQIVEESAVSEKEEYSLEDCLEFGNVWVMNRVRGHDILAPTFFKDYYSAYLEMLKQLLHAAGFSTMEEYLKEEENIEEFERIHISFTTGNCLKHYFREEGKPVYKEYYGWQLEPTTIPKQEIFMVTAKQGELVPPVFFDSYEEAYRYMEEEVVRVSGHPSVADALEDEDVVFLPYCAQCTTPSNWEVNWAIYTNQPVKNEEIRDQWSAE